MTARDNLLEPSMPAFSMVVPPFSPLFIQNMLLHRQQTKASEGLWQETAQIQILNSSGGAHLGTHVSYAFPAQKEKCFPGSNLSVGSKTRSRGVPSLAITTATPRPSALPAYRDFVSVLVQYKCPFSQSHARLPIPICPGRGINEANLWCYCNS